MSDKVTFDDVYEIAAEVAEDTITKFLQNLVKLVPQASEVVDDIKDQQYEELKQLRQEKLNESRSRTIPQSQQPVMSKRALARAERSNPGKPIIPTDDFENQQDNDFAAIAHNRSVSDSSADIDSALAEIPLEQDRNLFNDVANSDIDNSLVTGMDMKGFGA